MPLLCPCNKVRFSPDEAYILYSKGEIKLFLMFVPFHESGLAVIKLFHAQCYGPGTLTYISTWGRFRIAFSI